MIQFDATIKKFSEKGEKTGWTYIEIPAETAHQLKPGHKKTFRVKGELDNYAFEWAALLPMGSGNFILPLNKAMRQNIKKPVGETLHVQMSEDTRERPLAPELMLCLEDAPAARHYFLSLPRSHQRYFSNWITAAKTDDTKTRRITQAINALGRGLGFGEMIRMHKKKA